MGGWLVIRFRLILGDFEEYSWEWMLCSELYYVRKNCMVFLFSQHSNLIWSGLVFVLFYHQLNGHGFGWTLGVGDGQGGLACCGSWGRKESDTTERLN